MDITLMANQSELIGQDLLKSLKESTIMIGDEPQYDYLVITNEEKENPFYSEEEIQQMSLEEMTEIINSVNQSCYNYSDKESATDDIRNISIEDHFKAEYRNTPWSDLKHDFKVFCYNQGGVVKVYHHKVVDEHKLNSEAVRNIFFDSSLTQSELIGQDLLKSLKKSAILIGDEPQYDYLVIANEKKENPFYSEEEIQKMSLEEMTEIINSVNQSCYNYSNKESAADDIRNISIEDHFKAEYLNTPWSDLKHDFKAFGCNQGDVVKVYYHKVADEHKLKISDEVDKMLGYYD